ncbi:MAG: DNA repair protein RadA [Defluviitaleaceae bacterium]|nr:DNA repair protein RadA [Defluviitaleaceae bacterium]
MAKAAKQKSIFECDSCGYESVKWLGRCVKCGAFNSFFEREDMSGVRYGSGTKDNIAPSSIHTLESIDSMKEERISTKIGELDRVLSGGIVEGSLILVGGDPGVGKSTLILQICQTIGEQGKRILYVSGEESVSQIKLRANRLSITTPNLMILAETNMEAILAAVSNVSPDMLIIDSIQTVYSGTLSSSPGSVTQVREATAHFMHLSKQKGISTIIVGHVTKEGSLAGPKILEHMVDTVLYFEGEKQASYRLIRAVKNRFGQTNEIGVFEMAGEGLKEILNPSEYMLSGRPANVSGSVITCAVSGSRPILAEVQALVTNTNFNMPRQNVSGTDYNRVAMLMAVLEKRAGMNLSRCDSYINIAGGIRIAEPALDAAIAAAIASNFRNVPTPSNMAIFGEIGLAGELRAVNMTEARLVESFKLGFDECILPKSNCKGLKKPKDMRIYGVSNLSELLDIACAR